MARGSDFGALRGSKAYQGTIRDLEGFTRSLLRNLTEPPQRRFFAGLPGCYKFQGLGLRV